MAADIEAGVVKNVPEEKVLAQDTLLPYKPSDISGVNFNIPSLSVDKEEPSHSISADIAPQASAPGISYFEVNYVESVSAGLETIFSADQSSISRNHGGGQVRVYLFQAGYGNANNATFAGYTSSPQTFPRCGSNLGPCSAGQTRVFKTLCQGFKS